MGKVKSEFMKLTEHDMRSTFDVLMDIKNSEPRTQEEKVNRDKFNEEIRLEGWEVAVANYNKRQDD